MNPLRVIIADDEPLARTALRRALQLVPDVEIIGEATHGAQAVAMVQEARPDLLLLDVRMPDFDGFGVLHALADATPPAVIFVTAFDAHAVDAFERNAVDYLVKPFEEARLATAIDRARQRLAAVRDAELVADRLAVLLAAVAPTVSRLERFLVRVGDRTLVVAAAEVDWLEAADNYVRLHVGSRAHLVRDTMRTLEQQLDPQCFARVHRSAMVNLSQVVEVHGSLSGDMELRLRTGAVVPVAQAWREGLLRRLRITPLR